MSLRQQWNIADPSMVEDDNQVLSMCGIFGEDHTRFKSNIEARNFGEEVFEFDMELNGIKRFEKGWNWEDFRGSVGSYQRYGLDPFEYHIPNAVAITHDALFYRPDFSVLYWKIGDNGYPMLRNKLVEVKGTRSIKNKDFHIYNEFEKRVIKPHNEKIRTYAKDKLIPKCLLEFEIFVYPNAYATGINAEINNEAWDPSTEHTSRLEIWTMDELEAVLNTTPMPNFQEEPRMLLKTKSVFDPRKVNEISGIPDWSDLHYKKKIFKGR